jgi:hypothetical protein
MSRAYRPWLLFALALSAFAGATASAQTSQDEAEIVVEGQRQPVEIRDFVAGLTPLETAGQLGRFVAPVCPSVAGLRAKEATEVMGRIRAVAKAVGAPVARPRCAPNLVLLVVENKGDAIAQLREGRPEVFGELPLDQIRDLETRTGPTAAWQSVSTLGADGMPLGRAKLDKWHGPNEYVPLVRGSGFLSRLGLHTIQDFGVALVVIEADALKGVDTRQIADYVVMRGMVGTGPNPGNVPGSSILKLFNAGVAPESAPATLTWWDYALLKSLYSTSNKVEAKVQRDQIRRMMERELSRVPEDQR